jgi:4-amino-4-deoxy-L-arabinose transferase-like glycosyltransferase
MLTLKHTIAKYLKVGPYGALASALIAWSVVFRLILLLLNYPEVNSDEGTMGIEAMHIAFQGQHPIYLYGQDYMGVLEAYLAAPLFRLFGVSAFTLRLSMLVMFALFLLAMYWLGSLLYSKRLALVSLGLLSVATSDMLIQQLRAVGGAIETILFGAWLFVIAYRLATSAGNQLKPGRGRAGLYFAWGFCTGIALWVHVLVLPFVLASGALLLIFCYREWRTAAIPCVLLGLLIGGFLLIPGYSAVTNALSIQGGGAILQNATPAQLAHLPQEQFVSTFLWGIPLTTWFQPICTYQDLPYLNLAGASPNLTCSLVQGGWSAGYLLLLGASLFMAALAGWRLWRQRLVQCQDFSQADQRLLVTQVARLLHLLTAFMVIVLYLRSPLSGLKPVSTRYLVGLLVATPGILWPLWQLTGLEKVRLTARPAIQWLSRAALILALLTTLAGTISTLTTVPAAYADAQQQQKLVQDLLHMHIRRVYLEYWTCYRLLFQSQEQILCARPPYPTVVGGDRSSPDARAVQHYPNIINPNVPFMFPLTPTGDLEITAFEQYNSMHHKHFRRYTLDGMALYIPIFTG